MRLTNSSVDSSTAAMAEFAQLLKSPLGVALLESEINALSQQLPALKGYNCLQLSVQNNTGLCDISSIGHYIKMGCSHNNGLLQASDLVADFHQLPIASDCIDIALLHHVLDFSPEPHQLLRETDRTLTAGGHLLLLGFNPISPWALYKGWLRCCKKGSVLCNYSSIRQSRLADWLALLNYDLIHRQSYFYHLPINTSRVFKSNTVFERIARKLRLPLGIFHLMVARKRSVTLTPVMPDWRIRFKNSNPATLQSKNTHACKQPRKTD